MSKLPTPPKGTRLYVIGDIHGRNDLLADIHNQIIKDARRAEADRNVIVHLGDYVDRGPDSRGVIQRLMAGLPGFEVVCLMGNHERMMLDALDRQAAFGLWAYNGGVETMVSYYARDRDDFIDKIPESHWDWIAALPLTHQEGDFLMVHAGLKPDIPIERQTEQNMLWIRREFLQSAVDFRRMVVHGHTIVREPEVKPNRIGIDTGAFHTGRLTCLVAQDGKIEFLHT